jgi:hypothetical protein
MHLILKYGTTAELRAGQLGAADFGRLYINDLLQPALNSVLPCALFSDARAYSSCERCAGQEAGKRYLAVPSN